MREDLEAAAFDSQSSSLIKLNNGTILYLREVNKFLALVCILREDSFERQGKFICLQNKKNVLGILDGLLFTKTFFFNDLKTIPYKYTFLTSDLNNYLKT